MGGVLVAEYQQKSRKVLLPPLTARAVYGVLTDRPESLRLQPRVYFGAQRLPLQAQWDPLRVKFFDGALGFDSLRWWPMRRLFDVLTRRQCGPCCWVNVHKVARLD